MRTSIVNVVRRGRTLHFRRTVPSELRGLIGRRELTRSLGNVDHLTARLHAAALYVASERLFGTVRAMPMLTDAQLVRLVQDFYATVLERENAVRLRAPPHDDTVSEIRGAYYGEIAARTRKALAGNRLDEARVVTEAMLKKQGVTCTDLTPDDWQRARQAVMRAGIDAAEALQARYTGDFNHEPRDKLLRETLTASLADQTSPAPIASVPAAMTEAMTARPRPATALLLSAVTEPFITDQVASGAWERQTAAQARATFRLLIDVCGDLPLRDYSRQDAGRFKEQLQRLPSDYGKAAAYRALSVAQIIARYEGQGTPGRTSPITAKTIKRHFSALSALWTAAEAKGDVDANIFVGFRFGAGKRAVEERDLWETTELATLFASPVWSGCASDTRRAEPGSLILRDEKFWLPLIAVFSGMRQEEICQLGLDDVRQVEGVWFFDLNTRDGRMLKNATAVRRVPIHDQLVRLGLLGQVTQLRGRGETRLFPQLKPGGADRRLGHAFTKWFTRYRRQVGLNRAKLVFHSFRHTATTLMHEADVQAAIIDRVTGHTTPGETARYTKRTTLRQLQTAINAINIGVDLSHLYQEVVAANSKASTRNSEA
ncbi:tyrosine-type recombinase/integrase [Methylorubrum extorquens]